MALAVTESQSGPVTPWLALLGRSYRLLAAGLGNLVTVQIGQNLKCSSGVHPRSSHYRCLNTDQMCPSRVENYLVDKIRLMSLILNLQ